MSCRILYSPADKKACLYCSTSDTAFGPIFGGDGFDDAEQEAEAFCGWIGKAATAGRIKSRNDLRVPTDPRSYQTRVLMDCYTLFRGEMEGVKA